MPIYPFALIAALAIAVAMTPLVVRVAERYGAVRRPGGRHVHTKPTPRLGGLAMLCAFQISVGAILLFVGERSFLSAGETARTSWTILLGSGFVSLIGAWDDLWGLAARYKFGAQLVASITVYALGCRIESVCLPFVGELSMGLFSLPVTVLWIVGVTNAVNLIDGLDGLAAGVSFFAALTNLVVALINGQTEHAILMASLLGATAGFLVFNFNPAKIFMGDSGSFFLGFVLSVSAISSTSGKTTTAVSLLVPILALGVPLIDTSLAIFRRLLRRRSIFSPDRKHIHHRLLALGLTHRASVLVLYGLCLLLASGALAVSLGRNWEAGTALFLATVAFTAIVRSSKGIELTPEEEAHISVGYGMRRK